MGRAVLADARQHLAVFPRAAGTIKNQVPQVVYVGRKRGCVYGFQLGMQRHCARGFHVRFKMVGVLHWLDCPDWPTYILTYVLTSCI